VDLLGLLIITLSGSDTDDSKQRPNLNYL